MEKIKNFITSNKKAVSIIGGISLVAIIGVIILVIVNGRGGTTEEQTQNPTEQTTLENTAEETTKSQEKKTYSFLTGEPTAKKIALRRPIAVMYNNVKEAIPQSGIGNADVIYEAPVEGSITRLMAIFEDYDNLDRIGSVRSSRLYYAHWAVEYDSIYCHYGQSAYALDFLNSDMINTLSGLDSIGTTVYYRTSDRAAPHNVFTSASGIKAGISAKGYRTDYESSFDGRFRFAEFGKTVKLSDNFIANNVNLGYSINNPWFEYNKKTKTYARFQYGASHIDDQTNEQLVCTNIIIQFCDYELYPDGKSLSLGHIGSGLGMYITNGKGINITWKKDSATAVTKYYNSDGDEITLNTGKTWICIVLTNNKGNVVIS